MRKFHDFFVLVRYELTISQSMRAHALKFSPHDFKKVNYKFVRLRSVYITFIFIYDTVFENVFFGYK